MRKHLSLSLASVLELSISERIQFLEDVWDSITKVPEEVYLSDEQRRELDKRLVSYHKDPEAGLPWAEIKQKILKQK